MSRGQALFLRVFAVWTVYVWGTRIWNIWGDSEHSAGFKAVHTVLALVSVAFAVGCWIVVSRVRGRRARASGPGGGREPVRASRGA